jgi:ribonuclease P protein component
MEKKGSHDFKLLTTSRLTNGKQFDAVFSKPTLKIGNRYVLILARTTTLPYVRLGLVVAKKKIPHAVDRNRFKRLAKEHFRLNKNELSNIDIVLLARDNIKLLSSTEQNIIFSQLFEKLVSKNL